MDQDSGNIVIKSEFTDNFFFFKWFLHVGTYKQIKTFFDIIILCLKALE